MIRLPTKRKQRAILVLFLDGFSAESVGRFLGVTLAVVCRVLRKALSRPG